MLQVRRAIEFLPPESFYKKTYYECVLCSTAVISHPAAQWLTTDDILVCCVQKLAGIKH